MADPSPEPQPSPAPVVEPATAPQPEPDPAKHVWTNLKLVGVVLLSAILLDILHKVIAYYGLSAWLCHGVDFLSRVLFITDGIVVCCICIQFAHHWITETRKKSK